MRPPTYEGTSYDPPSPRIYENIFPAKIYPENLRTQFVFTTASPDASVQ
jgi:hypothetical protein